jgi:hypothetical protein
VLLAAGCGSVEGGTPDAPTAIDAPAAADAPIVVDAPSSPDADMPRCSKTAAFGTPVLVAELNTSSGDGGARLTPDELSVYFSSNRPGGAGYDDVYLASRLSVDDPFGTPSLLVGVNTTGDERDPSPTADGLTLYTMGGAYPDRNIYRATRPTVGDTFTGPSLVADLNTGGDEARPYVLPDHSAIYFAREPAGGTHDLYRAAGTGGTFEAPAPVVGTNLNTAAMESHPVVSNDELTIYFDSGRGGGLGGYDIWMARRVSTVVGFDEPVNLATLNSGADENPSWVSEDECVLYFQREIGENDWQILRAVRGM